MALQTNHIHQDSHISQKSNNLLASSCMMIERSIGRVSSLRRRYLFTNRKKLRLRYFIPSILLLSFVTFSAISELVVTSKAEAGMFSLNIEVAEDHGALKTEEVAYNNFVPDRTVPQNIESAAAARNNVKLFMKQPEGLKKDNNIPQSEENTPEATLASFYKIPTPEPDAPVKIKIEAGQTVTGQLQEIGVASSEAYSIVKALGEHFDPRRVRPGQAFEIEYDGTYQRDGTVFKNIAKMTMPLSPAKQIVVYKENEAYKAKEIEKEVITSIAAGRAAVKYSLYGSAAKANIPDEVIGNMIKIFSWSVDFQRDIRSGDEIEILYETKMMEDGTSIGYGDILYARLVTGGRDLSLYRHKMKNGHIDYFDPEGNSIKRTLMKTPVDGARVSSGYGMRHHPVLGYSKMHKGVDFAAPRGTPIYAAGDGVIEKAGRNGSFGNYIRIRHNSKLKTAYAHLHNIKSGIRAGTRVKQGQVIGTVGTTGRSTGPHLHYEVLLNGKHSDPRGVNVPTGEVLTGNELQRFKANKVNFDQKFAKLSRGEKYANAKSTTQPSAYNN